MSKRKTNAPAQDAKPEATAADEKPADAKPSKQGTEEAKPADEGKAHEDAAPEPGATDTAEAGAAGDQDIMRVGVKSVWQSEETDLLVIELNSGPPIEVDLPPALAHVSDNVLQSFLVRDHSLFWGMHGFELPLEGYELWDTRVSDSFEAYQAWKADLKESAAERKAEQAEQTQKVLPDETWPGLAADANTMAAAMAACTAYGTMERRLGSSGNWFIPEGEEDDPLGNKQFTEDAAAKMAAFLRQWPDATPEALVIHMRRKGYPDVREPGPREMAAWRIFAFTLAQLDEAEAKIAAEKAAQERAESRQPKAVDRDQLAMVPEDDNPLSEMGRAALRRSETPALAKSRQN